MIDCQQIKDALLKGFPQMEVHRSGDTCVIVFPILTAESRLVEVFVEPKYTDFFLIHDAGKAANELILQGMEIGAVSKKYERLAARFKIAWKDEMFVWGCKQKEIPLTALAVASCSAIATADIIDHQAMEEDESGNVKEQFGAALRSWARKHSVRVKANTPATGTWSQHRFDFLATPRTAKTVAINIINPSGNALAAAQ